MLLPIVFGNLGFSKWFE